MKRSSKRSSFAVVALTLLAAAGTSLYSHAQTQTQPPSPARSRSDEMLDSWNAIGNKLVAMAQDFPEDKYDFKVQKDQRTFAENLLHAAALDFVLIRRISASNLGPDFGEGDNPSRDVFKTKTDVVKFVQEAVTDGAQVIQQQGDAGLDKTSKFFGNRLARNSSIWTSAIEHSGEHYGQLVVYYRANNLVPPDSRRNQAQQSQPTAAARVVDLKAFDGAILKASYFSAGKPGPGVLLFHQNDRSRTSWDDVAGQLASAGINTLAVDGRGHGESGGTRQEALQKTSADMETFFQFLISQPGVQRDVIGLAGAGSYGVINALETGRLHAASIKSLVMLSGDAFPPGVEFLHEASQLPELFVIADTDEYPPTVETMLWLYDTASSPMRRLMHYPAAQEAPWLWYETSDPDKVPQTGSHGADLFKTHPDLPGIIVQWFVATLIKTPGHAPVDPLAAAAILNRLAVPGGAAQVTQQLMEARKRDPETQLFPEASLDIIASGLLWQADTDKKAGHLREATVEMKAAIENYKLNLLAYPDSADAHFNLADAYSQAGEKALARQYAEKALTMIDSHAAPLSSWSDTEQRRAEVRSLVEDLLKKLNATADISSERAPGAVFRDCPACPEMVLLPAGSFTMGSSAEEKSWAASHGGSMGAVADEAPQHQVSLPSFALGKYDVTRGEYAAFARETGYPPGDGCGRGLAMSRYEKDPQSTWENPGFKQTDRDPVVCVSWHDAKAYVAWLNERTGHAGAYRLPSESEWEYAARAGATSKFWWGDDVNPAPSHAWFRANSGVTGCEGLFCAGGQTHPVGAKPPNAFGLYDMAGNVWQWTEDCYDNSYTPAPADGRANEAPSSDPQAKDGQGNCLRVDRGSSWMFPAWLLRPANRERNPSGYRNDIMGFRVARTLPPEPGSPHSK
jgi:formylglycine-generating enzyme required for sulfatase activity